ncbi:hypothetical protein HDU96_005604, partial [Phlyctochytrium bullatum]
MEDLPRKLPRQLRHCLLLRQRALPPQAQTLHFATQLDSDAAAGKLPEYMLYTPDMNNVGHDTGLSFASNWVKGFLQNKLGNPAYSTTLFVVTFDESASASPNKI